MRFLPRRLLPPPTTVRTGELPDRTQAPDDLLPLAADLKWSVADSSRAIDEGWDLFNEGKDATEIQRDDEAATFPDDEEAYQHVITRAERGSPRHLKALAMVRRDNPLLWCDIVFGCDTETDLNALLERHFTFERQGA